MISTENRATMGRVMALGFLMAMLLAVAPAGATTPSDKAFSWGYNYFGQLDNDTSGPGASSGIPAVNVKNLSNVRNFDGGFEFTLADTE
jgi:hypothetical protein